MKRIKQETTISKVKKVILITTHEKQKASSIFAFLLLDGFGIVFVLFLDERLKHRTWRETPS